VGEEEDMNEENKAATKEGREEENREKSNMQPIPNIDSDTEMEDETQMEKGHKQLDFKVGRGTTPTSTSDEDTMTQQSQTSTKRPKNKR
jgi:hypothetical protein